MTQRFNIVYHIIFWLVYTISLSISEWRYEINFSKVFSYSLMALPIKMLIVYFNWFFLLPKYFKSKKLWKYGVLILISLVLTTLIFRFYELKVITPLVFPELLTRHWNFFIASTLMQIFLVLFMVVAFTTALYLYSNWKNEQKRNIQLEVEKKETELKYLKSQINPHFLFNTLNTIYSLSLENSKKVPKLLLELSDFLSFSLYETNNETVPISKEIALIENFIELQKDRFINRVKVNLSIKIKHNHLEIPPMLLITFVENAFKHGLKNETGIAEIDINLKTDNTSLYFNIENTKVVLDNENKQTQGIGLKNIRRRLDLIYNNQYDLNIQDTKNNYKVTLKLNCATYED